MAPAQLPGIGGEDHGIEPGLPGAVEQGDGQLVVVRHVQLEEARSVPVGCADVFDRCAARRGQTVGEVEFARDLGDGDLALVVVDFVDADRCEPDGCGYLVAEDFGGCIPQVRVYQLVGDDPVAVEGLSVGQVSIGHACVGRCIEPGLVSLWSIPCELVMGMRTSRLP